METALDIQRTPDVIAAEINSIKSQTRTMVLCNSIEIGRRLVEAKAMMEHGQWGTWIECSVEYSKSTANNLMRIFDEYGANQTALFGDNTKSQALGSLSYTQAVALLGVPEEDREQFIEEHDIESMSTRELQAAIKERDEALKKLETAQKVAREKEEEALKYADDKHQAEANLRVTDKAFRESQADVKMLQETYQKDKDRAKAEIVKLEKALDAAKASGDSEEAKRLQKSLDQTETELGTANDKIKELERQLKEKPIDVSATIEKIPDEVVNELNDLRKSAGAIKFKVIFDGLISHFNSLLASLDEMDTDERGQYKNAVDKLITMMAERL